MKSLSCRHQGLRGWQPGWFRWRSGLNVIARHYEGPAQQETISPEALFEGLSKRIGSPFTPTTSWLTTGCPSTALKALSLVSVGLRFGCILRQEGNERLTLHFRELEGSGEVCMKAK